MQTLANIAFGAIFAAFSLGPAAWEDMARFNAKVCKAAMTMAGAEHAASPLDRAVAKARAALPHAH